jgi:hypothetical protein
MSDAYRAAGDEQGGDGQLLSGSSAEAGGGGGGGSGGGETKMVNPCTWFKEAPLKRYPFAIFCICGMLTVVWVILYLISGASAVAIGGAAAVLMSGYGAFHFKTLLALKAQVDHYRGLNVKFKGENGKLKKEVNRLETAELELREIERSLTESNRRLKENVEKFRQFEQNLSRMTTDGIQGLEKIKEISDNVSRQVGNSLIMHEKAIYQRVYTQFQRKYPGQLSALTEEHFNDFWRMLPPTYLERFQHMNKSFRDVAGDDMLLDFRELMSLVEQIAEYHAKSGGS